MRSSARLLPLLLSALPVFVLVGSGARATDSEPLLITISATPTSILPPDETTLLSITVENRSATRVEWERGSSSCQLVPAALVSGTWLLVGSRVCTADGVPRGLDPGQVHTESYSWNGQVFRNQQHELLPPGRYQVRGMAGLFHPGNQTVTVTLLPPPPKR